MPELKSLYDARYDGGPVTAERPLPAAEIALTVAGGATAIGGDEHANVVAASGTPRAVEIFNRGPGDATFVVGADASGADAERKLNVGDRRLIAGGARFTARISVFAVDPTTIEWETWS